MEVSAWQGYKHIKHASICASAAAGRYGNFCIDFRGSVNPRENPSSRPRTRGSGGHWPSSVWTASSDSVAAVQEKKRALQNVGVLSLLWISPSWFFIHKRRSTRARDVDGLRRAAGATPPAARRLTGDRAAARVAGESRRALRFAKGRPARLFCECRGRDVAV